MAVGHSIFDWIKEGHDINIITVTDGRACYRKTKEKLDEQTANMTEDQVAEMRINEARKVDEFLSINPEKHYFLYFHDADGQKYVREGIKKVKKIIQDAERLVLPSNNNRHIDHQATHDIAINAAKELNLNDIEYWVYFIPAYGRLKEDSKEKLKFFKIEDKLRNKLVEWLQIYQSQKILKLTWKMYGSFLKNTRMGQFAFYRLEDKGKYYNF